MIYSQFMWENGMKVNEIILSHLNQNNILDIKDLIGILDYSFDGICLSDKDGRLFYVNQAFERLTGINRMDFIGKKPTEYKRNGMLLKVAKKISDNGVSNIIQLNSDGKAFLITTTPVHFKGELLYYSNFREINQLSNLQMELLAETNRSNEFDFAEELKELLNVFSSKHIVMKSPVMINLMKTVLKIAKTDITVNITGETGVGKDVMAKMIHNLSARKGNPFIQINCGSIPESLLESELFGYIEGSFTGASKHGRTGLLESANSGTVFLDEIGDLPLNLQAKLLKVLQDQEIYRIGGRKSIILNIRFICATNQNITQMVKDGKFREDLYFRINMIPIHIPPLRERREDIIHLCQFFMQKNNKKYGQNKLLSTKVCNMLDGYSWPGNIRELKHLIERLVIVTEGDRIEVTDLPGIIIKKVFLNKNDYAISNLKIMMNEVEKDIVIQTINQYGCRQAAEKLEIDYSTLKRKKRKFNLK